ncbi:MAG: hypothetical protein GKC10_03230 [Methanosarcinales archaeon]|nr:hypothetical protein [Methanosarcinales archaeon]
MRKLSLSVLLVFVLSGLAMAEDAGDEVEAPVSDEAAVADQAANETEVLAENDTGNATSGNATSENATAVNATVPEIPVIPQLQGIWFVDLQGAERVNMALNQSSEELFGAAKYEGSEPWNAVVVGRVQGDQVQLVLTALKGEVMVPIFMEGTFSNEAMTGKYSVYNTRGKTGMGTFTAEWINPETSGYTPAAVATTEVAPPAETPTTEANNQSSAPVQLGGTTEFHDVSKDKDRIFSSPVSMIPPGMGGSGL